MLFKQIAMTLSLALALNACSWIRTTPKSMKTFQSKTLDLNCVKEVPAQLQLLFAGTYTESAEDQAEIKTLFGCIDKALNTFSNYTRGSNSDSYQPKELQLFANRYLPSDNTLSDDFIRSIFKVKSAIVGGTSNSLTKNEIGKLRTKLVRFGEIIGPFAPHLAVILSNTNATQDQRHAASASLNQFVLNLSVLLSDSENSLGWIDLTAFVRQLELYTKKSTAKNSDSSALTYVREQLPIYQYAKLLIVGGEEGAIEKEKWRPIFDAISHFYQAMFLSSNTTEVLEQISIEVQSTEQDQARATAQLVGLLKTLKLDPTLKSRPTIEMLSDRLANALLINAIIFPRSQGSLALKPFLETASLRRLAGYILEEIKGIELGHPDPAKLQLLADNISSMIEQASISNSPRNGQIDPLVLSRVQEYLITLEPLFLSNKQYHQIDLAILTFKSALPLIIGRDGESLTPRDFRNLFQKAMDLYMTWSSDEKKEWMVKVNQAATILLRYPSLISLNTIQIDNLFKNAKSLVTEFSPATQIDWDHYEDLVTRGLKLKSLILGGTENNLSFYELSQLNNMLGAFAESQNTAEALLTLSERIKTLQEAPISDLINVMDSFLPENQRISSFGVSSVLFGKIKAALFGGNPKTISKNEYPELVRFAAILQSNLGPKLKTLPSGYKFGLNSDTMGLVSSITRSLIEMEKSPINVNDLSAAVSQYLQENQFQVRPKTLDKALIGFTFRLLAQNKGTKPKTLNGLFIKPSDLTLLQSLAEKLELQFREIEDAWKGLDSNRDRLQKTALLNLFKSPELITITKEIQPILNPEGRISLPHKGEINDRLSRFDLIYKTLVFNVVNWVYPSYKIARDVTAPESFRLTETDMTDLLFDLNDLIEDLKLSFGTSTPEEASRSRMRSINLFTRSGNGDDFVDPIETTEFLTFTYGGKSALQAIQKDLFPKCNPDIPNTDSIKTIPMKCLIETFFDKSALNRVYGEIAPQLMTQLNQWNSEGLETFKNGAMTSTYAGWNDSSLFPRGELETLVSIPYYIENLFERFDANQDDTLQFSEAMSGFPVFCREIQKTGGTSLKGSCLTGQNPNQIEAVYGYLLFRGQAPRGIRPEDSWWQRIKAAKDILGWFNFWGKLDKRPEVRDRYEPFIDRKQLLKIMANLSTATKNPTPVPETLPAEP